MLVHLRCGAFAPTPHHRQCRWFSQLINKGIPAYEEALKKASIDYKIYMYEGAQHAFNNDTNPARYNKEVAQLAWQRTISFLKEKLKI